MGFIDYIQERNYENYGQFIDTDEPFANLPAAQNYSCSQCPQHFSSLEELFRHSRQTHPISTPLLALRDRLFPRDVTIRKAINTEHIRLENCARIEYSLNGDAYQECPADSFCSLLQEQSNATLQLKLINERSIDDASVQTLHTLRFRISEPAPLLEIEKLFTEMLDTLPISTETALEFWDRSTQYHENPACRDFANALSVYLIGVSIKQGEASMVLQFNQFKEKFLEAYAILKKHSTPLAQSISEIIQFNLNNFSLTASPITPALSLAYRYFSAGGATNAQLDSGASLPDYRTSQCPVDDTTFRIIQACSLQTQMPDGERKLEILLNSLCRQDTVSVYDKAKINFLMADWHIKKESFTKAAKHLRAIRTELSFKTWAEAQLTHIHPII